MAITNIQLDELPSFGRRLMILAKKKNIGTPTLLAEALYSECKDLVEPAKRKNKYGQVVKDRSHDVEAIKRAVQNHFNEEEACKIPTKYLIAYSKIFECSIDYLCGLVDVSSINMETRCMCEKLHLNDDAVNNLINNYDPDPEVFSPTRCWSYVLSNDAFYSIPDGWLLYRMNVLQFEDLRKKINSLKKAEKRIKNSTEKAIMEVRRIALEKMQPGKKNECEGAFKMLSKTIFDFIDLCTDSWIKKQHIDIEKNYYDNEIKKIEILERELKDGSEPINKSH